MPQTVVTKPSRGPGRPKGVKDSVKRKPGTGLHGNQVSVKIEPTEEDLPKITQWAAEGRSRKIIASRLGISNGTLDKWMIRSSAVREAWERGQSVHEDYLNSVLEETIADPKAKMRVPAAMFLLKVKHKYSERHQVEVQQQRHIGRAEVKVVETDPSVREEFERQLAIDSDDA